MSKTIENNKIVLKITHFSSTLQCEVTNDWAPRSIALQYTSLMNALESKAKSDNHINEQLVIDLINKGDYICWTDIQTTAALKALSELNI